MEMTGQIRFVFVRYCVVFSITSQLVIYLFDVVAFFDDVRNRFYFGTFELRMEIMLQLSFVSVCHCNFLVAFVCKQKITKKLRN